MNIIHLTYNDSNIYLVPANDGWLMVDTGWPDTFSPLLQLLNQNNIAVNEINYLLITHYHPGHAGLTQNLKDLGTNLIIHEAQIPYYNKLNLVYKRNPQANFKDITSYNNIILSDSDNRSFLQSIGIDGEIVTTPGHSDDSISLIVDDCCAFVGDLPDYFRLDEYNDLVLDDSWDIILSHNVNNIYPGHGEPYVI